MADVYRTLEVRLDAHEIEILMKDYADSIREEVDMSFNVMGLKDYCHRLMALADYLTEARKLEE